MGRTGTKRLIIKKEGFELELERGDGGYKLLDPALETDEILAKHELAFQKASLPISRGKEISSVSQSAASEPSVVDSQNLFVTSPMVGTFYSTPGPEDPPFVKVGDRIEKNTVVCIIEAMKVMNEVKAGVSGTVAEVLVENGHPVEFGTKLFRVTP